MTDNIVSNIPMDIPDYGFADCPEGSHLHAILDKCRQAVSDTGADPNELYVPSNVVKDTIQGSIETFTDLGASWTAAIVATTVAFRAMILPLNVKGVRQGAVMAVHKPNVDVLRNEIQAASTSEDKRIATERLNKYSKDNQVSTIPWANLAMSFTQITLFMNLYSHFRGVASHPDQFRTLVTEAPLWLDSLALPDPTYGLPLLAGSTMILGSYLSSQVKGNAGFSSAANQNLVVYVTAGGAFFMIAFMGGSTPAALWVAMVTNSLCTTAINYTLNQPMVRSLLDIPLISETRNELDVAASPNGGKDRVHLKTLVQEAARTRTEQGGVVAEAAKMQQASLDASKAAGDVLRQQQDTLSEKSRASKAAQANRAAEALEALRQKRMARQGDSSEKKL